MEFQGSFSALRNTVCTPCVHLLWTYIIRHGDQLKFFLALFEPMSRSSIDDVNVFLDHIRMHIENTLTKLVK
jgi:hypothetical protein